MKLSLVCIGSTGAQVAEILLHCAFCGALPREDVIRVSLLAAPDESAARLKSLYAAYGELRSGWGLNRHTALAPILSLRIDPLSGSLADLASSGDTSLLRCMFSSQEMHQPAVHASPRAASVYWACLLDRPEGVPAEILADAKELPTVVCASLADPCGTAALEHLAPLLNAQPFAALMMSTLHGEDPAPVRRFLDETRIRPDMTALVGLPDDCASREEGPHLAHLLLVRALDAFLTGARGEFGFRAPTALDWSVLDPGGARWGAAFDCLLRFDALWHGIFLPDSRRALRDGTAPRGRRSPWLTPYLGVCFGRADLSAATERQLLRAGDLAHRGACWLRSMQRSLPFVLRTSVLLNEARDQAAAHYEQLLRRAGQLALLEHDIRLTGMTPHTTIHRHDMEDTEDETALIQREALREALQMDIAAQRDYDLKEGGRVRLNTLREIAAREREEADTLRRQAAEAHGIIDRAAANASPENLAKIDQARARLRRMERRLASLEGRARQAERDARSAGEQDARTRPPVLDAPLDAPSEVFWPAAWLDMLCGLPRITEARARTRQTQTVLGYWPWSSMPAKGLAERVPGLAAPDAAPALRLIDVVLHVCGA